MIINALKSQLGNSMESVLRFLERPVGTRHRHPAPGTSANRARAQARDEERHNMHRMRREVYELLEQHPSSRQLMRHLDLVERTLRRQGVAGVEALPVRVVAKALTQLERLVGDWTAEGLAELRSRLVVLVRNREAQAARAATPLAFDPAMPLATDVTEVRDDDLAMFREMERSWAGRMPEAVAKAAAAGTKVPSAA